MKKVLLVLFVLVVSTSLSLAGTPMTSQGTKALSFVINGLGTFGVSDANAGSIKVDPNNVSGGLFSSAAIAGFGGKYYISNDVELRGVVSFSWSTDQKKDNLGADANKLTSTVFGIAPAILWHMMAAGPVSPYAGVGGKFGWAKGEDAPKTGSASSVSGTAYGVSGILGAEWFAWDNISLNAEYQLGFSANTTKTDNAGTSVDTDAYTNIGISSWAVGINVYIGQ